MHQGCGDQRAAHGDHQAAEQRAALAIEHVEQRAHGWRIARELEEAHDAQHQQQPQVVGQHEGEPERQHRDQIDDAGGAERVFKPRVHGGEVAVRAVLDGDPQPQAVFGREHDERENLDRDESERIAGAELRHRLERDRDQVNQD
jgi:hypothetical protein